MTSALLAAVAGTALALQSPAPDPPVGARDPRSIRWVASAASRVLASPSPSSSEFAAAALAIRGLDCASARAPAADLDALRDRLCALQRENGSFGDAAATWIALGALEGSARANDVEHAGRAQSWLRTSTSSSGAGATAPSSESIRKAMGFLERARATPVASADVDKATRELYTLAGGPFDTRAAYANAIAATAAPDERTGAAFAATPLHALALNVAVLDHYRTSLEAALLAESTRPAAEILREVATRSDPSSGAWSREPAGAPDLASSACALLILDTLERWDAARRAQADSVASSRGHVTAMRDCEECHRSLQPSQFEQWRASRHSRVNVGCSACHGTNHSTIFREGGAVSPAVCAQCHPEAAKEFAHSRHALAQQTLESSALFAATPPAARAACMTCHRIGARQSDGTTGSCNHCHAAHVFSATQALEPEACTLCHTGNDYPQDLAYKLSKHGTLYAASHDPHAAPTCATCHQPGGRHDDGFGLTYGSSGAGGAPDGSATAYPMRSLTPEEFAARRSEMVAVCTRCHSSRLAEESLRQADDLKREGDAQVLAAAEILRELSAAGYFGPASALMLGPQFGRPDPRSAGADVLDRFYQMWRFDHASAWKGAYHQSASVANHASGAGTHEDLEYIEAQAQRWRARGDKR